MDKLHGYLKIMPDVQRALDTRRPVVALDSTHLKYGMPYPQNVKTSYGMIQRVREQGAIPATIAVIHGKLCIGLSAEELEFLGSHSANIQKIGKADLPLSIMKKDTGVTTVAASMILSVLAGIKVFAAAGVGGAHLDMGLDISGDLEELSRVSSLVVCSGLKTLLDPRDSLEYLETHGVPVVGFGTGVFPSLFACESPHPVDCRVDSAGEAARIFSLKEDLGLSGGVLIANPPPDFCALDREFYCQSVHTASQKAKEEGIAGKHWAPYLLEQMHALTGQQSLETHARLMEGNARLAAQIAQSLNEL